jgi:hypothetical protein
MKKYLLIICLLVTFSWGAGRLYFATTGGFTLSNIRSSLPFDPRFETRALSENEKEDLKNILNQEFTYIGKGCQSYVFESQDKNYVIKFLKYQRFRNPVWLNWLSVIPQIDTYRLQKVAKKKEKLDALFTSWCLAFDRLQNETGLVFVHLNKGSNLNQTITIYDKLGLSHQICLDEMEFLVQRKADMLCSTLSCLMNEGKSEDAKAIISSLVQMVEDEYVAGLADNDHALMQNTGVYLGKPIHIDVGQFVEDVSMLQKDRAFQELYNKTYKFKLWLKKHHPELSVHLEKELYRVMGDEMSRITFIPKVK